MQKCVGSRKLNASAVSWWGWLLQALRGHLVPSLLGPPLCGAMGAGPGAMGARPVPVSRTLAFFVALSERCGKCLVISRSVWIAACARLGTASERFSSSLSLLLCSMG